MENERTRAHELLQEAARLQAEARKLMARATARLHGHLTPTDIYRATGIPYVAVVRDIRAGELHATRIKRRSQVRYYVSRQDAAAWMLRIGIDPHVVTSATSAIPAE